MHKYSKPIPKELSCNSKCLENEPSAHVQYSSISQTHVVTRDSW